MFHFVDLMTFTRHAHTQDGDGRLGRKSVHLSFPLGAPTRLDIGWILLQNTSSNGLQGKEQRSEYK